MLQKHPRALSRSANLLPKAVCGVIYQPVTMRVLAVSRGRGSKEWALVGGKVDPGETPEQAMVREAWEEARVRLFNLREILTDVSEGGPEPYLTTAFAADSEGMPQGSEEGDVDWVPWETVLAGPFRDFQFKVLAALVHI